MTIISNHGRGYSNIRPELNGEVYFLGLWAKEMECRAEPAMVLDVGANEGDFADLVLQKRDAVTIHCFEPNPTTAARLSRRFQHDVRVNVHNLALGENEGSITLYDQSGREGTGVATAIHEVFTDVYKREMAAITVPMWNIDRFMETNNIRKIDLVTGNPVFFWLQPAPKA